MKVAAQALDSGIRTISSSSLLAYKAGIAHPFLKTPFKGHSALSIVTSNLRKIDLDTSLQIFGYLVDFNGNPLPHTGIEIWHRSPSGNKYHNRALLYSNSGGYYEFITNLPEREKGKNYEVYFRVEKDNRYYYTKLIFNNVTAILSSKFISKNHRDDFARTFNCAKDPDNHFVFQFDIALSPDLKS